MMSARTHEFNERLTAFRDELARQNPDGCILSTGDEPITEWLAAIGEWFREQTAPLHNT